MSYLAHQTAGQNLVARCAVLTLSDTRDEQSDTSGARICEMIIAAGHVVARREIIPDDALGLDELLSECLASPVDVIITNGGTGISPRDQTMSVVERAIDVPLPGFGELFRMLSWEQIGSGAMLSRAAGGIARGKIFFALPGSTKAVELAMSRLILPELGHLLGELRKRATVSQGG